MQISGTILLLIVSLFIISIAYSRRFFSIKNTEQSSHIKFTHLFFSFILYLGTSLIIPLFCRRFLPINDLSPISYYTWVSFFSSLLSLICISTYLLTLNPLVKKNIIKQDSKSSVFHDLFLGAISLIIVFPITILIDQSFHLITSSFFPNIILPDQVVVSYIKMTLDYPLYLTLAILFSIVFAPITEEIFFRGFLFTYLRKFFDSKGAIVISAILFSLLHYSRAQGFGNIPILLCLFILGLMLGFLYERQKSLYAPIALHAIFNTTGVFSIIFFQSQA